MMVLAEAISRNKDEILSELLQYETATKGWVFGLCETWALVFSLPFLVLVLSSGLGQVKVARTSFHLFEGFIFERKGQKSKQKPK